MPAGFSVGLTDGHPFLAVSKPRRVLPTELSSLAQFSWQVFVEDGEEIAPTFTFGPGAPLMRVDFGDGSPATSIATSGVPVSKIYTNRGLYTIRLIGRLQELCLKTVDFSGEPIVVPVSWPSLVMFKALTNIVDLWVVGLGAVGTMRIGR